MPQALTGAPTHSCGQPMELGVVRNRLCFFCKACHPKFPERTKPALHCPVCGKPLSMEPWPGDKHDCPTCQKWYKLRPWHEPVVEPGAVPVYDELSDDELLAWTEENPTRYPPWGKGTQGGQG